MGAYAPLAQLSTMTEAIIQDVMPSIEKTYTEYTESFTRTFPLDTEPVTEDGLRMRFQTEPSHNAAASGRLTSTTQFERAKTSRDYGGVIVKPAHVNSIQSPLAVLWSEIEYAKQDIVLHDIGFNKANDAYLDMAKLRDIMRWSDRNTKIGAVARAVTVSGDVTDNTTDDHLEFTLYLDETAIPAAFTRGQRLHITAPARPITALRNYDSPVVVCGTIKKCTSVSGAYWEVPVYQSYLPADVLSESGNTVTDSTEVTAEVESIADGDYVCIWGGGTAGTSTLPSHGPRYGFMGIRDWYARTNIQSDLGACSTALTNYAGTALDRSAETKNLGWLAPAITAKESNAQITWSDINALAMNLALQDPDAPLVALLANPLMTESLADQAGVEGHRWNGDMASVAKDAYAMYGVSGAVYRSVVTGKPIVIGSDFHVAADMVMAPKPGALKRLSPAAASFVPGAVFGLWTQRHDATTGKLLPVYDATLHESSQLFATAALRLCGVVSDGTP